MPALSFFFFLFLLLFSTPGISSTMPIPRRALHLPFFPPDAPPPGPSFPKYPSSSTPQPFFPSYPSPPPPAVSSSPTADSSLPANISSLIFPNSHSAPPHRHSAAKIVPAVALPLVALSLLAFSLAFFLHGRRRRRGRSGDKAARSNSIRLFPPGSANSVARKSPAATSDCLYVGTLVDPCGGGAAAAADEDPSPAAGGQPNSSPYCKVGSPELHPLPPLSLHAHRGYGNADGGCSSEEEFYSPRGSSGEKESSRRLAGGRMSSSRRTFPAAAAAMEKCGSRNLTISTPSYPSSNSVSSPSRSSPAGSSPPVGSSPGRSSVRSLKSRSENYEVIDFAVPPPPPPPPPPVRPLTPSPPKRKPPSPSPPSSPVEKDQDGNFRISDMSGPNLRSPQRIGDFSRNPLVVSSPQSEAPPPPLRQAPRPPPPSRQAPPPPPPPPPPPVGYWESRVRKPQAGQPPVLTTPRPTGMKNSSAAVFPAESPVNADAAEKSEESSRPKLKPLHWDKVRASSDRAMVWDQLKTSSFQ